MHLAALQRLVFRYQPALVSEHLAWSVHDERYFPDLLPLVRTTAALRRVADRIDQMQSTLQCRVAIENPTHYLPVAGHEFSETDFLRALVQRTGCRCCSTSTTSGSARAIWAQALLATWTTSRGRRSPDSSAGHTADPTLGEALLIDSHDQPVSEAVATVRACHRAQWTGAHDD